MVRYAPIVDQASIQAAASLLEDGFGHPRGHFDRLLNRRQPASAPNRGLLLEADGTHHGVILLIFSEQTIDGETSLVCNISSWFIRDEYRSHAMSMFKSAVNEADVIYTVYTPNETVRQILPIFGFRRMECQEILSIPLINFTNRRSGIRIKQLKNEENGKLSKFDVDILKDHNQPGYLALHLEKGNKETALVLHVNKRKKNILSGIMISAKVADVIYCGDYGFLRSAMEGIHRYLILRGILVVGANWPFDCDPINGRRRNSEYFVRGTKSTKYLQPIYSEFSFMSR